MNKQKHMKKGEVPVTVVSSDNIPETLRNEDFWINWANIEKGGEVTKVPCNTKFKPLSATDKKNQLSFEKAMKNYYKKEDLGIGFVFNKDKDIIGVDIDDCVDEEGNLTPEIKKLVGDDVYTYVEWSPSKTGIHLYFWYENHLFTARTKILNKVKGAKKVEVYPSGRFFTVTGNSLLRCDDREIGDSEEFAKLEKFLGVKILQEKDENKGDNKTKSQIRKEHNPPRDKIETDEEFQKSGEIISKAQRVFSILNDNRHDLKPLLSGLWEEAGYPSRSEADLGLCKILLQKLQDDEDAFLIVDEVFRNNSLYRDKWDRVAEGEERKTYGQVTLEKAQSYINGESKMTESKQTQKPEKTESKQTQKLNFNPKIDFPEDSEIVNANYINVEIRIKDEGKRVGKALQVRSMHKMLDLESTDEKNYLVNYLVPIDKDYVYLTEDEGKKFINLPNWLYREKKKEIVNDYETLYFPKS